MPLVKNLPVHYHTNPLDARGVLKSIRKSKATMLFTTPTFLQNYSRVAKESDFSSLRHIMVGAEKLSGHFSDIFEEKFGIKIMEGYGATELSPVACVNVQDRGNSPGYRLGTVGRPLPGVELRTVHSETGEPLPDGETGVLQLRGANVMKEYWKSKVLTEKALTPDGWYSSGDIANIDSDGFVTLKGRISRFSKIAGEMVPHGAVEEAMQQAVECAERVAAVTSVPDVKRGERLVVFHTPAVTPDRLLNGCKSLPALWRPAHSAFISVPELPILATGKLDLGCLKKWALSQQTASDLP